MFTVSLLKSNLFFITFLAILLSHDSCLMRHEIWFQEVWHPRNTKYIVPSHFRFCTAPCLKYDCWCLLYLIFFKSGKIIYILVEVFSEGVDHGLLPWTNKLKLGFLISLVLYSEIIILWFFWFVDSSADSFLKQKEKHICFIVLQDKSMQFPSYIFLKQNWTISRVPFTLLVRTAKSLGGCKRFNAIFAIFLPPRLESLHPGTCLRRWQRLGLVSKGNSDTISLYTIAYIWLTRLLK